MRSLLAAATLALVPLSIVTPAHAAPAGGSLTTPNVVLYESCPNYSYRYRVVLPDGTESWSMDVTLYGRDGLEAGGDFVYDEPTSGRSEAYACLKPGRYTVKAEVEYYDVDYNEFSYRLPTKSFTVRPAKTRTALQVANKNPRKGAIVTMRGTVKDERPRGYFPTNFAKVVLEVKVRGRWQLSRGINGYTNERGKVTLKGRFKGKAISIRLRTKSESYDSWRGSVSKAVRLH